VFVGNQESIQPLRINAQSIKPPHNFPAAQPRIDENPGSLGFYVTGISLAARSQNAKPHGSST
jgi:hypothetical protein